MTRLENIANNKKPVGGLLQTRAYVGDKEHQNYVMKLQAELSKDHPYSSINADGANENMDLSFYSHGGDHGPQDYLFKVDRSQFKRTEDRVVTRAKLVEVGKAQGEFQGEVSINDRASHLH